MVMRLSRPLEDTERPVVKALREKQICGFNELCYELSGSVSRPTVQKALKSLVEMRVVKKIKAKRRGQKDQYTLTETWTAFEERFRSLELGWEELFHKLEQLKNGVNDGRLAQRDAGSSLVWLIFEAVPLLPLTLAPSFPLKLNERLLGFSAGMFRTYWEEIIRLGHEHPEICEGFQEGCEELRRYVKPVTEKIEEALGK